MVHNFVVFAFQLDVTNQVVWLEFMALESNMTKLIGSL